MRCHRHSGSWNSCSKSGWTPTEEFKSSGWFESLEKSATLPACSQVPRPALILFLHVFGPEFERACPPWSHFHFILFFFSFLRYNLYLNTKLKMRPEWWPPGIKQSLPLQHWGSQAVSWGLASCAEKQSSVLTHVWEAPHWLSHLPNMDCSRAQLETDTCSLPPQCKLIIHQRALVTMRDIFLRFPVSKLQEHTGTAETPLRVSLSRVSQACRKDPTHACSPMSKLWVPDDTDP